MDNMEVHFHNTETLEFIHKLDRETIAKVLRTIELLQEFGNNLSMPHSKPVARGIFELRTMGKMQVRILYTFRNTQAVILHAFIKKSQKIPKKDINLAQSRLKEFDKR